MVAITRHNNKGLNRNGRGMLCRLMQGLLVMVPLFVAVTTMLFGWDLNDTLQFSAEQFTSSSSISIRDIASYYSNDNTQTVSSCLVEPVKSPTAVIATKKALTDGTTTMLPPPQNSSTATVMAMATGYRLDEYKLFVGSLRKSGYQGHIILAVSQDLEPETEKYFKSRNVDFRKVQYVNCTHPILSPEETMNEHDKELVTCVHPYPSLKHRWARFPLLRDYLRDCVTCTGPVLITDMRDTVFQRDPFGPDAPVVPPNTLQVFQEHYTMRTTHWLVDLPVKDCRGVQFDEPMLCSGTTIGTRSAMLEYLRVMHVEMDEWMKDPKCCCFKTNGDDQSIHNYLFYSGKLDHIAVAIPNRVGLVNTVGVHAALIFENHVANQRKALEAAGENADDAHMVAFDLTADKRYDRDGGNWLGLHYGMTDNEGYLVNFDGTRSFVVHQIDRFGFHYIFWLEDNKDKFLDD
ncbi:hypothetical protein IV203_010831 [Nitzschia inconspicua]|uniref:Uncharacterized protein n=1 Tax=Nitzschia inconspicua TaxID=303405 RepID=A0A9K3KXK2_9STRA|nr:hypothetical protein IV203_010831 [Nitzschia inconspicua]